MLEVRWGLFGQAVSSYMEGRSVRDNAKAAGMDKSTMSRASRGVPVTVEAFLTLCNWMQVDPLQYAFPARAPSLQITPS